MPLEAINYIMIAFGALVIADSAANAKKKGKKKKKPAVDDKVISANIQKTIKRSTAGALAAVIVEPIQGTAGNVSQC